MLLYRVTIINGSAQVPIVPVTIFQAGASWWKPYELLKYRVYKPSYRNGALFHRLYMILDYRRKKYEGEGGEDEIPYTKENERIFCLRRLGLIASIGGAASCSSSALEILYRVSI